MICTNGAKTSEMDDYYLQIVYIIIDCLCLLISTLSVPTIAGFPHLTVGTACSCVAQRPVAGAVLCYYVVLLQTLQCTQFARAEKD